MFLTLRTIFLGAIGAVAGNGLCHPGPVTGNGVEQIEERPLSGFTRVESNLPVVLRVAEGPAYSVQVTADSNVAPLIRASVRDGTLFIEAKGDFKPVAATHVDVVMPETVGCKAVHALARQG